MAETVVAKNCRRPLPHPRSPEAGKTPAHEEHIALPHKLNPGNLERPAPGRSFEYTFCLRALKSSEYFLDT